MRIKRKNLRMIIESFLFEAQTGQWVCPKCGHKHDDKPEGKCSNCGHKYDDPWQGKDWTKPKEKITLYHSSR